MGKYHRLTHAERYQIEALTRSGKGMRATAKLLGRDPGTISRELKRNSEQGYGAAAAIERSKGRRAMVCRPLKIRGELEEQIRERLKFDLSPEQISGSLRLQGHRISHETIYKFAYAKDLWPLLRWKRKRRRKRTERKPYENVGAKLDRVSIKERPEIVARRERLGDFERDTMEGVRGKAVLLTIVDRKSRLTKIRCLEKKSGMKTHAATLDALKNLTVRSITNDNGPEFSEHGLTAMDLKAPIYFSRPFASWQRGTNENTNGLIRQYFQRGTEPTAELARFIEQRLNNRPRKCLGYRTPNEIHRERSDVALSS